MKRFLQKIFHKNPLSYLGWLGFIGVVGLVLRTPVMIACLLCFTFFAYSDMIADELFWANVRRAGFRAFLAGFLFSILCLAILVPRAIYYQFPQPQVTDGMVQLSEQSYLPFLLCGVRLPVHPYARRLFNLPAGVPPPGETRTAGNGGVKRLWHSRPASGNTARAI